MQKCFLLHQNSVLRFRLLFVERIAQPAVKQNKTYQNYTEHHEHKIH